MLLQAPPRLGYKLVLVEVKDSAKSPSQRVLTPQQAEFHKLWKVTIITSPADLLKLLAP